MTPPSVVVVGGSIGGHSLVQYLVSVLLADTRRQKLQLPMPRITVIEPRRGLINPIAIPRTLVDREFAPITFAPPSAFSDAVLDNVDFVRGSAVFMDSGKVDVQLDDRPEKLCLPFDFSTIAVGRHRAPFVMPPQTTKAEYLTFVNNYADRFRLADRIVIIGGGAVGIELAGELKYFYPNKTITLLHSRDRLPPEPSLDPGFSVQVLDALQRLGVDTYLNTRVTSTAPADKSNFSIGKEIVTTLDGKEFHSDLTVWCTFRGNPATEFMDPKVYASTLDEFGVLKVNPDMTLVGSPHSFEHIYAIGDVNDFPVIKTAGGAVFQANIVAQNLARQINIAQGLYESCKEDIPDVTICETWGDAHMAVIIGQEMAVCQTRQIGLATDLKDTAKIFGGDMSTSTMWKSMGINQSTEFKSLDNHAHNSQSEKRGDADKLASNGK
ncbi:uncharacterized protein V2V93DRAFT_406746 [Kockiozyma suomiensis]|uniref:uncharacterized protein n=1 Tax=Kockiozyma suomiensis TaxID=1337062 RepID=UPI003343CD16